MIVKICENYEEMSNIAAKIVCGQVYIKPDCVLGLATGSTPIGMYKELCRLYKAGEVDFSEVKAFNLDEYYPIEAGNEQSYHKFMNDNLFSKVNIKKKNIHIPDGMAKDPESYCIDYENKIKASGGIDLQILGIGQNGHIGFNEPSDALETKTHITELTESTIKANSRFFSSISEVPTKAITMGVSTILRSRKILLLANGTEKHDAIQALLREKVNTNIPATLLSLHPDVVVLCDRKAYYGE